MKFFQVKTFCTTRVEIFLIPSNSSKQNQSPYHGERGVKAKKATWLKKEEQEQEVEQKHHLSVTSFVKSHFSLFKGQMMLHAMRCLEDLGTLGFDIEVTR